MKISKINLVLPFVIVIALLTGCSDKIGFPVSTVVPAANADAKVKIDGNNNYVIDLEVENLASAERLVPAKKMYVVWIETTENGIKNMGQLVISKSNNGSLKVVTPFKPRQIIITAEDEATLSSPSSLEVLRSDSF